MYVCIILSSTLTYLFGQWIYSLEESILNLYEAPHTRAYYSSVLAYSESQIFCRVHRGLLIIFVVVYRLQLLIS